MPPSCASFHAARSKPLPDHVPILVAAHPRSGTHLVLDLLRRHFRETRSWRMWGRPVDYLYLNLERLAADHRRFSSSKARKILSGAPAPLMKTHYLPDFSESWVAEESGPLPQEWREKVAQAKKIYVYRDPRDVMVSYKQFMSGFDSRAAEQGLLDFVLAPHWSGRGDRLGWWQTHVESWAARPDVLVIAYEELTAAPRRVLDRIAGVLGLEPEYREPILPPKVTTVTQARLCRLLSLAPSSTAIVADRRRFPAQRWATALSPADQRRLEERLEETMARLDQAARRDAETWAEA